jgi:hypothetical protein
MAADSLIKKKISPRYNRIGVISNFNAIFIFKFFYLLSLNLKCECMPPEGVHVGEQSALARRMGPLQLLIGKPMPGSTSKS